MLADGAAPARAYAFDIAKSAEMDAVARRIAVDLGPVEVLANVAGIGDTAGLERIEAIDDARWSLVLAVNLSGAFYWCRALLPGMAARGRRHRGERVVARRPFEERQRRPRLHREQGGGPRAHASSRLRLWPAWRAPERDLPGRRRHADDSRRRRGGRCQRDGGAGPGRAPGGGAAAVIAFLAVRRRLLRERRGARRE